MASSGLIQRMTHYRPVAYALPATFLVTSILCEHAAITSLTVVEDLTYLQVTFRLQSFIHGFSSMILLGTRRKLSQACGP